MHPSSTYPQCGFKFFQELTIANGIDNCALKFPGQWIEKDFRSATCWHGKFIHSEKTYLPSKPRDNQQQHCNTMGCKFFDKQRVDTAGVLAVRLEKLLIIHYVRSHIDLSGTTSGPAYPGINYFPRYSSFRSSMSGCRCIPCCIFISLPSSRLSSSESLGLSGIWDGRAQLKGGLAAWPPYELPTSEVIVNLHIS